MTKVNMLEAKTNLSKLVEAVETGKESEIILARNGKPVARIVPIEVPNRIIGIADGEFGDLSPELLVEWDRENEKMWAEYLSHSIFPEEPAERSKKRRRA